MNNPSAPPLPVSSAPQSSIPNPFTSPQNVYPGPTIANQDTTAPVSSHLHSSDPPVSQSNFPPAQSLPQPPYPVNSSTQHPQQMPQTAGVPGAQALAPLHVPGQGTMYPILGQNGQIMYSFQPQPAPPGNPNGNPTGIQGFTAGMETQIGSMNMSTDAKPIGAQGSFQNAGMHPSMTGMPVPGGVSSGMGIQQHTGIGGQQGLHGSANGMAMQNGLGMQGNMNEMGASNGMNMMGMQGGMHRIGASYGMHGMGMQGGMNTMGMQGGTNSTAGQGGAYGVGGHPEMSNMGMQNAMNPTGMQGGMTNMAAVSQTPMGGHAGLTQSGGGLQLKAVGGFKDMSSQIHDLPEVTITDIDEAGNRLFALKSKVNELQAKHDSYKNRQIANGGVAAASALFTFGTSLLVQGPAAVHQHNRMQTIKRAMPPCLEQINLLRDQYGAHPSWPQREAVMMITEKVFTTGVNRSDLKGGL